MYVLTLICTTFSSAELPHFSHHSTYTTVEPPNKGHFGTGNFVLGREVVCRDIYFGARNRERFVLFWSVHYRRFHCISFYTLHKVSLHLTSASWVNVDHTFGHLDCEFAVFHLKQNIKHGKWEWKMCFWKWNMRTKEPSLQTHQLHTILTKKLIYYYDHNVGMNLIAYPS